MRSKEKSEAVPYRVALMLKKYKFGSNIAARYLDKPRGLVQSWMQAGESHSLAESQFKMAAFEKKLKSVRRKATQDNLFYLLALRLFELSLPPEYIGKHLGIPPSTVRSWKEGVSPKSMNKLFVDRNMVDKEFNKLMQFLRYQSTKENLVYYLSLRLSETARTKVGKRRIGGKTISMILTKHFNYQKPIPKETINCWIDGRRRPKNAFEVLKDPGIVEEEYKRIEDELTMEHIDYHLSKALHDRYDWSYSKISKVLGLDKERVRGWVIKGRGNPVAKCYFNEARIEEALKEYVDETMFNGGSPEVKVNEHVPEIQNEIYDFDLALEDEITYHLSFFPSGVGSPHALKSILIENKEAEIGDIISVLNNSPRIQRKGKRWVLKEYTE
jgi:hypothetical protein